jgi:hypothetical protein
MVVVGRLGRARWGLLGGGDLNARGLIVSQAQAIATDFDLNRVAHGSPTDDFDLGPIAQAHLHEAATKLRLAGNTGNRTTAANAKAIK